MVLDNIPVNGNFWLKNGIFSKFSYFWQMFDIFGIFRQNFMKNIESDASSSKTITPLSKMG